MSKIDIKTKQNKASVKSYLQKTADPQMKKDSEVLLRIMQKATGSKPMMWGSSLIGFGKVDYKYASGREGEWLKIGFAPRKNALSLYLTCDLDELSPYLKKLGAHTRGVGCLYIKKLADIDLKILTKLIDIAVRTTPKYLRDKSKK